MHVARIARKKLSKDADFIGPRNYQHFLGQNPPPEMVEAFKRGMFYQPAKPVEGFHKGKRRGP